MLQIYFWFYVAISANEYIITLKIKMDEENLSLHFRLKKNMKQEIISYKK